MGWWRRLSPEKKAECVISWRQQVKNTYADLISKNEVSIDWDKFKLDDLSDKKDFFNKLFSLASSSLDDKSYFLDFGVSRNILEANEEINLQSEVPPDSGDFPPVEIKTYYKGAYGYDFYTNTDILKSHNLAMPIINHYFYDADLSDPKVLDTLNCLKEFFPETLSMLIRDEYRTQSITLERLKQINTHVCGENVLYHRSFEEYQKWKDTISVEAQLKEIDHYLSTDETLKDDDIKVLQADYMEITGKELTLLSNGKDRETNMLDIISSGRYLIPSNDTCRALIQYPGTMDYIKNTSDVKKLTRLYEVLIQNQTINSELCNQICRQTGTKLFDSYLERGVKFPALLYFYQKNMLSDEQTKELKNEYSFIMRNEKIKDIFYQKGDMPCNIKKLPFLIKYDYFTEKDMAKVPVLTFSSDQEKAHVIARLSGCSETAEQEKIVTHYLKPYMPLDFNFVIKNLADDCGLFVEYMSKNLNQYSLDAQSASACAIFIMKNYDHAHTHSSDRLLLNFIDNMNLKDYIANDGNIEVLGNFLSVHKDKIKNFDKMMDEIVRLKPQNISSLPFAIELANRGYKSASPETLISYYRKMITVAPVSNPEIYNFEKVFLQDAPYQHSSGSHTTFLNEMLWYGKKQGVVMALNNGASPFTKAGFFRDKFTAMPFNMFFNRELKNGNEADLQNFMIYIASHLNEKKTLSNIWISLGKTLREKPEVKSIISACEKAFDDSLKERKITEHIKKEEERKAKHQEDLCKLQKDVVKTVGDCILIADERDLKNAITDYIEANKNSLPFMPNTDELKGIYAGLCEEKERKIAEQQRLEAQQIEKHKQELAKLQNKIQDSFDKEFIMLSDSDITQKMVDYMKENKENLSFQPNKEELELIRKNLIEKKEEKIAAQKWQDKTATKAIFEDVDGCILSYGRKNQYELPTDEMVKKGIAEFLEYQANNPAYARVADATEKEVILLLQKARLKEQIADKKFNKIAAKAFENFFNSAESGVHGEAFFESVGKDRRAAAYNSITNQVLEKLELLDNGNGALPAIQVCIRCRYGQKVVDFERNDFQNDSYSECTSQETKPSVSAKEPTIENLAALWGANLNSLKK